MRRIGAAAILVLLCVAPFTALPAEAQEAEETPEHIVVVALPAVIWGDLAAAETPRIDALIDGGAVAAISVRTASRRTVPERGFLSLGAGNRTNVSSDDLEAHLAFDADARYEGGTAAAELARRQGTPPTGDIVHLGEPLLDVRQDAYDYGARAGSLGTALREAGIPRAVVSAADHALAPTLEEQRRASVLAIVDDRGSVDTGTLRDLLTEDPEAPYGVRTDPEAFDEAVDEALERARVVLVEPGETSRIEEYDRFVLPGLRPGLRRQALERTDDLVGIVADRLGPRDLLVLVGISTPLAIPDEHLTPLILHGHGVERGWLTSPTTRRDGLAVLTDVAPTVLGALGVEAPASMTGTQASVVPTGIPDRAEELVELDRHSRFREVFTAVVVGMFIGLLVVITILAGIVFLWRSPPALLRLLVVASFGLLAIPSATAVARAAEIWRLGDIAGQLAFWPIVAAIALLAALAGGPRWRGAVLLFLFTAAVYAADLLAGAPLQLNGVFGYSPIVAGRFYGSGNLAHAILYSAGILGLTGLADLRGHHRAPWWVAVGLFALPPIVGLPWFGANFGGVLAGIPAVVITFLLARHGRIRWRWIAVTGAVAVVLTGAIVAFDFTRDPGVRTHLGRFAGSVAEGGLPSLWTTIQRKAQANLSILELSRWTLTIPFAVGVIVLLLWKPKGVLRAVLPNHPVLNAGLVGTLVAGVVGFAVNDSGIAITVMALGHLAPFLVLMGVETISPHSRPSERAGVRREPSPATPRP